MREWIALIVMGALLLLAGQQALQYRSELKELQALNAIQAERYSTLQKAVLHYNKEATDANRNLHSAVQGATPEEQAVLSSKLPAALRDSLCSYATCR